MVAKAGRDPVCPEEGSRKVAPGIAETGAMHEDIGCMQGYRVFLKKNDAVPDLIPTKRSQRSAIFVTSLQSAASHRYFPDERMIVVDDPG